MALTFGGGAGVLTIPGLTGDGLTPSGIVVAGNVASASSSTGAALATSYQSISVRGVVTVISDQVLIQRHQDISTPLEIKLSPGSSGTELIMKDSTDAAMWEVDADGTESLAGSLGINGIAAPGFPVLATGAAHTVDNVISLLQSYGLCKQS